VSETPHPATLSRTAGLKPYQFKPGQSGNPHGRPRKGETALEAAKRYAPPAMLKLAEMAGLVPGVEPALFESTRLAACRELLDRALGRPAQMVQGDADRPLTVKFQWQNAMDGTNNSVEQAAIENELVFTTEWSEVEEPAQDASDASVLDED
jgi:Family of unknown function (DUF5681)